ncbi:thiazole synthase [Vibrio tritonius]|uniref:thiazole synthase n=1 Tax=Vibrio tritonius TaxID=1435069 RepID=UPI00315C577C
MFKIADTTFSSRLFSGTGKFSSNDIMLASLKASGSELVTVALKRVEDKHNKRDKSTLYSSLVKSGVKLLPNTSGARNAKEAVFAAQLARELFGTNWVKLEIHPDSRYLMPDGVETLLAAEELVRQGFIVLPYCHCDPVLCKRLEEVGCSAVMPLASPIGSNQGIVAKEFLRIIIEQAIVPVVVDAGIGRPSDASYVLEMGADAVLVNTAIASARNPIEMAEAFRLAVRAGRLGFESGLGNVGLYGSSTSPLCSFLSELPNGIGARP